MSTLRTTLGAFVCALVTSVASAQSLPTATSGPAPQGFSTELATTFDFMRGNAKYLSFGGSGYARLLRPPHLTALYVAGGYTEASSERLLNSVRVLGRYRRQLFDVLDGIGAEAIAHFERSEPRRHEALVQLGAGPYTTWYASDAVVWTTTAAYVFEFEKFTNLTDPNHAEVVRDEMGRPIARGKPVIDAGLEVNSHRAWLASELAFVVRKRVRFGLDLLALVPLDHCACDTRIVVEAASRLLGTPHFDFQFGVGAVYDPTPPRLVESLDLIAKTALVFSFPERAALAP